MTTSAAVAERNDRLWRSMLFVPANRPDLIAKQERFGADVVVLDLEDGTPLEEKSAARESLARSVPQLRDSAFDGTILVRVNSPDEAPLYEADIACVRRLEVDGVVLPKVESASQVDELQAGLDGSSASVVVLGFESVAGVSRVETILAESRDVAAAYFGGEDYIADLGGRRTADGLEVLYPRSLVSMACQVHDVHAIDTVVLSFDSSQEFLKQSAVGRDLGYAGKLCIHPAQVRWAHELFTPSLGEAQRAQRLLDAYGEARARGVGTINFEGQMVDTPLVLQAERVVAMRKAADRAAGGSSAERES